MLFDRPTAGADREYRVMQVEEDAGGGDGETADVLCLDDRSGTRPRRISRSARNGRCSPGRACDVANCAPISPNACEISHALPHRHIHIGHGIARRTKPQSAFQVREWERIWERNVSECIETSGTQWMPGSRASALTSTYSTA